MTSMMDKLDELDGLLADAKGIAWDTCHKIYILMDDAQMEQMRKYGYDPLISCEQMHSKEMFKTIVNWYTESCGLKFVQIVDTLPNGESDYTDIIEQFAYYENYESED